MKSFLILFCLTLFSQAQSVAFAETVEFTKAKETFQYARRDLNFSDTAIIKAFQFVGEENEARNDAKKLKAENKLDQAEAKLDFAYRQNREAAKHFSYASEYSHNAKENAKKALIEFRQARKLAHPDEIPQIDQLIGDVYFILGKIHLQYAMNYTTPPEKLVQHLEYAEGAFQLCKNQALEFEYFSDETKKLFISVLQKNIETAQNELTKAKAGIFSSTSSLIPAAARLPDYSYPTDEELEISFNHPVLGSKRKVRK